MELEQVINHIFTYSFPSEEELVRFANARHGFGGDDAGYGVIYPSDLDEYEKEAKQQTIPEGSVEIYCLAYTDKGIFITETQYLMALKQHLVTTGHHHLANELKYV